MYVTSSENIPVDHMHSGIASHAVESLENRVSGTDFSIFDPGIFGDIEDNFSVDFLDNEESTVSPHDHFKELSYAAAGHLSKSTRRRRPQTLEKISAEDFEPGSERNAFYVVHHHAQSLFSGKYSKKNRDESIRFFFESHQQDIDEITLELCCDVLRTRVDVLRLRIQYEFWLRGSIFTGPFPFVSTLPKSISNEIIYYSGDLGLALAREAWIQPGLIDSDLLNITGLHNSYSAKAMHAILESLEDRYLMSSQAGRWYVTGRNPLLMNIRRQSANGNRGEKGGSYYWSRLFGERL